MRILDPVLDENERILWKREDIQNIIPDEDDKKKNNKLSRIGVITTIICIGMAFYSLFFDPFDMGIVLFSALIVAPIMIWNTLAFFYENVGKQEKRYELLSEYHSDAVLSAYPKIEAITNKHLIRLEPDRWEEYPIIYGSKNIEDIFEYRNEFCFLNLDKLTVISDKSSPEKDRYRLGLYFDVDEEIMGDDAPHHWLDDLKKEDYSQILNILARVAPQAQDEEEGWY